MGGGNKKDRTEENEGKRYAFLDGSTVEDRETVWMTAWGNVVSVENGDLRMSSGVIYLFSCPNRSLSS